MERRLYKSAYSHQQASFSIPALRMIDFPALRGLLSLVLMGTVRLCFALNSLAGVSTHKHLACAQLRNLLTK